MREGNDVDKEKGSCEKFFEKKVLAGMKVCGTTSANLNSAAPLSGSALPHNSPSMTTIRIVSNGCKSIKTLGVRAGEHILVFKAFPCPYKLLSTLHTTTLMSTTIQEDVQSLNVMQKGPISKTNILSHNQSQFRALVDSETSYIYGGSL